MFVYCNNDPVNFLDPTGQFMVGIDFLNRAGGFLGVISPVAGGGANANSQDVANQGSSANRQDPHFSPGKRTVEELWDEIMTDIMCITTAIDNLPDQYPALKLYAGGNDVYSGIGHIKTGVEIFMVPIPTPIEDVVGVGLCVFGILEAAGGLVKVAIALDRLD